MYCLSYLCCDFQFSTSCTYIVKSGMVQKSTVVVSCCLALFLPLISLPGDISGLAGTNLVNNQLDTGHADIPTITGAVQDSGAIDVTLEGGEDDEVVSTNSNTDGRSNEQLQSGEKERLVNVAAVIGNGKLGSILGEKPNGQDDETTKAQGGNRMEAVNPATERWGNEHL